MVERGLTFNSSGVYTTFSAIMITEESMKVEWGG